MIVTISPMKLARLAPLAGLLFVWSSIADAGRLRDRIAARRAPTAAAAVEIDDADAAGPVALPPGVRVIRDVAYGPDRHQRFDVYAPEGAQGAPVLFMVHGGGWARGDKTGSTVVGSKLARWVPRGFLFISTNYRMLPQTDPVEQARDVARAVAAAQEKAASFGGDRSRFVLMGHSAGAHLVALLTASPRLTADLGVSRWIGTVSLDSAALDVVQTMEGRHFRLHDQAFGTDRDYWKSASPFHALAAATAPMLAVCSTRRADACPQARAFVARASALGGRASVLEEDLSHREINARLGENGDYTSAVEEFLRSLHPTIARLLAR
jgi:acetyl esterase/lipase